MSDVSKERFQYFIQQALAEYELLHAQIAEQAELDLLKPLPVLLGSSENPKLMKLKARPPYQIPEPRMSMNSLTTQEALPGSIEDSQLCMLEAGQLDGMPEILSEIEVDVHKDLPLHPIEGTWTSDFDVCKDSHRHPVTGFDSLSAFSVLPGLVENSEELPRLKAGQSDQTLNSEELPRLKAGQSDQTLDSETSMNTNVDVGRDLKRHPTAGTCTSSVQGFVGVCLGETPGAIQNPDQVKKALERMSEEQDTISFTSAISRLIGKASYKERGLVARIAKSKYFEGITMLLVILNGIWIAIDADYNHAGSLLEADPIFQVTEHLFCFVFTIEIMTRFMAFKNRRKALCDPWFVFDGTLVVLLILETWIMPAIAAISNGKGVGINISILRLLRVARLSRLARVVRAVPELCFMVKGVLQGTRAVACTMGLLSGVLYVFGIALRQLSANTKMGKTYFSTVPHAVFTLFLQGTLLDEIATLFIEVSEESRLCAALLFLFVVLAALTLMSMLVGVLCQVMNTVAIQEKERMAVSYVKEQLLVALEELDTNADQLISKEEFVHMISNEKATHALKNVGVDVVHLVDYADYYFQSDRHGESFNEKWSFDHFIEEIMLVRGVNAATVRDAVELRKFIHAQNTSQNVMLKHVQENQTILARNQVKLEHLISRGNLKASQCTPSVQSSTLSGC